MDYHNYNNMILRPMEIYQQKLFITIKKLKILKLLIQFLVRNQAMN